MAQILDRKRRILRAVVIFFIIVITIVYLVPLFFVIHTSFKPWEYIKEYPPKILFKPTVASYIRIFTSRTPLPAGVKLPEERVSQMKWYERLIYKEDI